MYSDSYMFVQGIHLVEYCKCHLNLLLMLEWASEVFILYKCIEKQYGVLCGCYR